MMSHPPPEFVPYNMINGNYNFNNNNGNNDCPLRHPPPSPPPPPPPGMGEMGPHNNPRPQHPVALFSVNRSRMYAGLQLGPRVHTTRMMIMMPIPGPTEFDRPFSPHLPSDHAPNHHTQHGNCGTTMETDFEEAPKHISVGTPVNFSLCKERFNGIGDVRPFINAILDFKHCSEMRDESALRSFSLLLIDQAANWWKANKTWVTDWNSAIKLLRNTYRARIQQHRIYRRFSNAPQNEETTAAFVQRTRGLLSKIPINTLTPETQLDLIFSMLHRRIKDRVNREDCDTVLDLMERARRVEESIAARATAPLQEPAPAQEPAPGEEPVQPETPAVEALEAATQQEPESLKLSSSPEEPAKIESPIPMEPDAPVTPVPSSPSIASLPNLDLAESSEAPCDHCRIYGLLFARTCRKLHKGERSPQNIALLEELSKLDAEKLCKMVCFRCRSDSIVDLKCQKCTHEVAEGYPLITGTIYEVDFNFVVDTGSSHSIASSKLMDHLIACGQEFAFNVLIMPVRGVPMRQDFRVANVEVMVAGIMIQTVLVDLPGATRNVFGMDFIKQAGLVLDFRGEGTWSVRNGEGQQPVFYERLNRLGQQN